MKQVAQKIEVPVSTYRDWEYGRAIQGAPYVKIANVFGISLFELLTGEKPKFQNVFDLIENAEAQLIKAKDSLGPLLQNERTLFNK